MTTAAATDQGVHADQRLPNGKLAMWIFLASEAMFFTGLVGSYVVLRIGNPAPFHPDNLPAPLNIPLATINTAILIASSLTMVLAVQGVKDRNNAAIRRNLLLTAGFGTAFCVIKYFEYSAKFSHGIDPSTSIFYSCYFGMTGVHLLHVVGGIVPLAIMGLMAGSGRFSKQGSLTIELMGLYWHFVDLVWIFLFPLLYLIR